MGELTSNKVSKILNCGPPESCHLGEFPQIRIYDLEKNPIIGHHSFRPFLMSIASAATKSAKCHFWQISSADIIAKETLAEYDTANVGQVRFQKRRALPRVKSFQS